MSGGRDRERQSTNTKSVDILGRACVCSLCDPRHTKKEITNELALTKFNQLLTTFGFARPFLVLNGLPVMGMDICRDQKRSLFFLEKYVHNSIDMFA